MPATKGTGAPGSPRGQRYRPASEFDDATLAQKREYWRNKKREQRAKLSEVKRSEVKRERSKATNRGSKSSGANVVTNSVPFNSSGSYSMTGSAPPLLNSDGSYQNDVRGAPVVILKGKGSAVNYNQNYAVGEGDQNCSTANQKERWFQRIKLNKVLPQFQSSDPGQEKGAMVCQMVVKSLPTGDAVIGDVTSAKTNGVLLNRSASASPVRVAARPSGSAPCKPLSGVTVLNGSSSAASTETHLATQGESAPDAVNVQHRLLTSNVATGTSQSNPVLVHKPGGRPRGMKVTPLVGKSSALVAAQGFRSANDTPATLETEEERAAKRRENWRIKKREQRAKQAASLKKASERTRSMDVSLQRAPQLSNTFMARPPSAFPGQGPRPCVSRARAPFASAGRLLKNARAVATVAVKRESEDSTLAKLSAVDANQRTGQLKLQSSQEANVMMQTHIASNVLGYKPAGELITSLPGPVAFANPTRGLVRCRTPRQRFIETQRNLLVQRNMRRFSCHTAAFATHNAPQEDPMETPEQMAARKREYWRVKKREQRAKLSVEVRAKMKERDGLLRRVKRYQSILEDMRKARVAGCNTLSHPTGNRPTHTSASETIGGFIKEDGTLTNKIPQIDLTTEAKDAGGMRVNNSFANTHHHHLLPNLTGDTSSNMVLSHPLRVNPPPLIRPAQVKVSCPPVGLSLTKPPRLVSIKPRTDFCGAPNSHLVVQPQSHITLTHPRNTQNPFPSVPKAMPHSASCVMKMSVKASNASAVLNLDPKLTEEERMAKKREYWRVKKREQRAARANRLRQGAQARGNTAAQKRRNQRLARLSTASPSLNTPVSDMPTIKPLVNTCVSTPPRGQKIKQERESTSVVAPRLPLELECVDIKPPPPPTPPEPPPPEPQLSEPSDLALSADSQATTLLAVASMKKLLEESLSTVADCKTEQPDCIAEQLPCKTEPRAYPSEEAQVQMEVKPNLPLLTLGDETKVSISADLSLEVKGWQVEAESLPPCQVDFRPLSPNPKDSLLSNGTETPSFPVPAREPQSHSPRPSHGASSGDPLHPYPRRAQRLRDKKTGHPHCCSPEPPKLHHQAPHHHHHHHQQQQAPRQQDPYQMQQHQQPTRQLHHHAPSAADHSVTLQKREYWRIMKRQQRARKARQGGGGLRQGDYSRRLALKAAQAPSLFIVKTQRPGQKSGSFGLQAPPLLNPQPSPLLRPISPPVSLEMHRAVPNIPSLLVVSPTRSNVGQPSDALQLKPMVDYSTIPRSPTGCTGSPPTPHGFSAVSLPVEDGVDGPPLGEGKSGGLLLVESQPEAAPGSSPDSPRVRKWRLQVQETPDPDTSPIATLSPPPNPLTSIKLLPVHPPGHTSSFMPAQAPFARHGAEVCQSGRDQNAQSSLARVPVQSPVYASSTGPPKPVPGESEEETLRKKREYWRVKKKEQRARKAMRDRELTEKRASVNWRPILPSGQTDLMHGLDTQEQDPDHWLNITEDSELLLSTSTETDMGYFPDQSHMEPLEDESELLHPEEGAGDGYNAPFSDAVWRNRYLMDYDPLNQLLVCMVCGDLQYSHSLEGVRAHIEDAHPDTLSLGDPEHQRILEAWDEQVSRRERFFTSQLQQHSGAMGVESANLPAEVEVMVDTEDGLYAENGRSSKTKPTRRL